MILIIDCGSSKTYKFAEIATKYGFLSKTILKADLKNINFEKYEKIIISGGPTLLTQNTDYYKDFDFIKKIDKPVLGVCLGHQIIGLQFGAKIQSYQAVTGKSRITVLKKDKIFDNINKNPIFYEDHKEYINLPDNFTLLAKSDNCENEAMKHNAKYIYGVQFHPEISQETGERFLLNFFMI